MKLWCPKCIAWVNPVNELFAWLCPGCKDELQIPEPEPESDDSEIEMEEF